MTSLKNSVQLIGHLGADPKTFEFEGGKMKTTFSMATSEYYRDSKGDRVQDTQWHTVVSWGKTAKVVADYLHKGSEVAVHGKLTNRTYEDKEGNKKYFTEVVAGEVLLLDKKN
jgi:single-strand DNA-binding protein